LPVVINWHITVWAFLSHVPNASLS